MVRERERERERDRKRYISLPNLTKFINHDHFNHYPLIHSIHPSYLHDNAYHS